MASPFRRLTTKGGYWEKQRSYSYFPKILIISVPVRRTAPILNLIPLSQALFDTSDTQGHTTNYLPFSVTFRKIITVVTIRQPAVASLMIRELPRNVKQRTVFIQSKVQSPLLKNIAASTPRNY